MIGQRVLGALRVRFLPVVVAASLGASALLGSTAGAGDNLSLILSCQNGDYNMVKEELDKGANVNGKGGAIGSTPLIGAGLSWNFNMELVRLLIERGAEVNAKNNNGVTALMVASMSNQPEMVKLLIEKGADMNAKDNDGKTALDFAKLKKNQDIVRILEAAGEQEGVKSTATAGAKAKSHLRRPKPAGGAPRPPELPAGGALSGN